MFFSQLPRDIQVQTSSTSTWEQPDMIELNTMRLLHMPNGMAPCFSFAAVSRRGRRPAGLSANQPPLPVSREHASPCFKDVAVNLKQFMPALLFPYPMCRPFPFSGSIVRLLVSV